MNGSDGNGHYYLDGPIPKSNINPSVDDVVDGFSSYGNALLNFGRNISDGIGYLEQPLDSGTIILWQSCGGPCRAAAPVTYAGARVTGSFRRIGEQVRKLSESNKKVDSAKKVSKNANSYVGETHFYVIRGPNSKLYKAGESSQGVRVRDEASIRAERQVRVMQRTTGDFYSSEIRRTFPDKASAREYQNKFIKTFERLFGAKPPGNRNYR